jgi:protein arginine kinase
VNPGDLAAGVGAWLDGGGPESMIVTSSRVRLARNLADTPFAHRADERLRTAVQERVVEAAAATEALGEASAWSLPDLPDLDRRLLLERQLASPRLVKGRGPRGVMVGPGESLGLQVNEEDHVRIQSLVSGFDLEKALTGAVGLDRELERSLDFATSATHGYLTACPTNVGTGMRASVLIHLPALVLAGEVKKVHRAVGEMGMAVRGWFGEGSGAVGDHFQLSNQRKLGRTEEESISELGRVVNRVRDLEIEARTHLVDSRDRRRRLGDRVHRSLGLLRHARLLTIEQVMACLSDVRLGVWLEMLDPVPVETIHRITLLAQPAHLAHRLGRELEAEEERWERAAWIRPQFGGSGASPA